MSSQGDPVSIYRPAWWSPVATVVFGAITLGLLGMWINVQPSLFVIVPLAAAVAVWQEMTIKLTPGGVSANRRTTAWADLRLHEGRFGESLRSVGDDRPRRQRVAIFLSLYKSSWRTSSLGEDVRRWAPDLLS